MTAGPRGPLLMQDFWFLEKLAHFDREIVPEQQQLLFENTAAEMAAVDDEVKKGHIRNCLKADPAYGEGVAKAMGVALADVEAEA